jgi:hypothetical protein
MIIYKDNLAEAKQKLQESRLFSAVIERANKKKRLDIAMTGSEKYNWPDPATGIEKEPSDHYDIEGHTWTDVDGFTTVYLWRWQDLKRYVANIFSWVVDVWDTFSIRYPLIALKFGWETLPFHITWEQWVWTVESLAVAKSDLVEDKIATAHEKDWRQFIRSPGYMKEYQKVEDATHRQEVIAYADKEYLKITDFMWVGRHDPTVILVDEVRRPFDYKDGWSDLMITSIIWEWAHIVGDYTGVVKTDRGGIQAVNPIKQDVLRGVADLDLGRTVDYDKAEEIVDNLLGEKK